MDLRPTDTQGLYPTIYLNGLAPTFYMNAANQINGSNISTGVWNHYAVSRSGTSTKLFVAGTQSGATFTDSTNYTQNQLTIANLPFTSLGFPLNGNMASLRITKGVARYTANFTPPTLPLPTS